MNPPSKQPRPSMSWAKLSSPLAGSIVGMILGAGAALVLTVLSPKQYESEAVIQVHPSDVMVWSNDQPGGVLSLESEMRTMKSEDRLTEVALKLDLAQRWTNSVEEAVEALAGMVEMEIERGTDLVRIRVLHANPADARDVAQAVGDVYAERRADEDQRRIVEALATLEREYQKQESVMEDLAAEVEKLLPKQNPDLVKALMKRESETERQIAQLRIQLRTLEQLRKEERFKFAAGITIPESNVSLQLEALESGRRNLENLDASGLGEAHPKMRVAQDRLIKLETELDDAVAALRVALGLQLKLLEEQSQQLENELEEMRKDAVTEKLANVQRAYNDARQMLTAMKSDHLLKKISLQSAPKAVTVHERPKVAKRAVSPNPTQNLALGSAIGIVAGFLLSAMMGFLARKQ